MKRIPGHTAVKEQPEPSISLKSVLVTKKLPRTIQFQQEALSAEKLGRNKMTLYCTGMSKFRVVLELFIGICRLLPFLLHLPPFPAPAGPVPAAGGYWTCAPKYLKETPQIIRVESLDPGPTTL